MPGKRTGIMPSKKKFTAVGGVGARPIALQNKISREAPRVTGTIAAAPPPPPPPPTPLDNLFNVSSFSNTLAGNIFPGFSETKLDPSYVLALTAATSRWNNFLSFHTDFVSIVKEKYKEQYGKEWKGLELVALNYTLPSDTLATTRVLPLNGTNIPYGFRLGVNRDRLKLYSQENIEHVFAHELGHALGLCNAMDDETEMLPAKKDPLNPTNTYWVPNPKPDDIPNFKIITMNRFPNTYATHHKLIRSAEKFISFVPPHIILSDDGKHWMEKMVSHEIYAWDEKTQSHELFFQHDYGNFFNEIITPIFDKKYDSENGYLISSKSLKYLTEIKRVHRLDYVQMYVEKTPGASEVSKIVRSGTRSNYVYILHGKAGVIVSPTTKGMVQVITVERSLPRDATDDANEVNDDNAYTVFYPEGRMDTNDDEIIQIVKNHERIVNDPMYNPMKCCSQERN